jgi:6,7-dimethyl-8-ribityllumazine synthase
MSSALKNLSEYDEDNMPSAEGMKFGIVVSEWNKEITHKLYEGCYDTLIKLGAKEDDISTVQVPGTFELTTGAKILGGKTKEKVDAMICIGCVIKGETSHNEYINHSVARGLTSLSIMSGIPHIFGVLTPNDEQQAKDRAGGKYGNKGVEAATTAIRMAALEKSFTKEKKKIGF